MEDININKELQEKNQEMLLNKKIIDLDNSMESLMVFYSVYTTNMASEINSRVCFFRNIDPNSEQGKIFFNTITTFFFMVNKKLKEIITSVLEPLKAKLSNIDDKEYVKELNDKSLLITNQISDYYFESINMLLSELNQDVAEDTKTKINEYVLDTITVKMMNMFKDKFMFSIKVINNNYEENKEVIESINEKTINRV